jgi:CubicO group peptidase (beta-lactamase class C family)
MLLRDSSSNNHGLSWDISACGIFNETRKRKGKSTMVPLRQDPSIRELLHNRNSFVSMNRILLAPDGTPLLSEDEFLKVAPLITNDGDQYPEDGWIRNSNANHIFAAMILEEVTEQKIHDLIQKLVFDPFGMTHTFMNCPLATDSTRVMTGYRISASGCRTSVPSNRYLSDVVEVAALGARSCAEDIAKLLRGFLQGAENVAESKFSSRDVSKFFAPYYKYSDEGAATLGGSYNAIHSEIMATESLNAALMRNQLPTYVLGKRLNGNPCKVYREAGRVDGFSTSVRFLLNDRAFVIVLGNSSGPLEITDLIAQYIIQEALHLSPRVDIVSRAIEERRVCSERLQFFELQDLTIPATSDDVEDLVGTYEHKRYLQQITITREGSVTIHGRSKTSSPMKLVRIHHTVLQVVPGHLGFTSDRWAAWENLTFRVNLLKTPITLTGNNERDVYQRIS